MEPIANCADPANVVADRTTGATDPMPAARATRPNETPKNPTVAATGIAARMPSRYRVAEEETNEDTPHHALSPPAHDTAAGAASATRQRSSAASAASAPPRSEPTHASASSS